MSELKPCPFCGSHAQDDFIDGESYIIECYACEAATGCQGSADDAIAAWNRRAPVSTPQQSAQRASVDTDDFRELLANWGEKAWGNSADEDMADECFDALIAHINAWGSAGSGATNRLKSDEVKNG